MTPRPNVALAWVALIASVLTVAGLVAVLVWAGLKVIDAMPLPAGPDVTSQVTPHPTVEPVQVGDDVVWVLPQTPVAGSRPILCESGQTLNDAGTECWDIVRYFEDDSWTNLHTGESGCTPGGLCEDPPWQQPGSQILPRGWYVTADGTVGCIPQGWCEDGVGRP